MALSWCFRNDPEFRREEIPNLEAAIARLLEKIDEDIQKDSDRFVNEVVPFSGGWPEGEAEAEELGERESSPDVGVRGRGREVEVWGHSRTRLAGKKKNERGAAGGD